MLNTPRIDSFFVKVGASRQVGASRGLLSPDAIYLSSESSRVWRAGWCWLPVVSGFIIAARYKKMGWLPQVI